MLPQNYQLFSKNDILIWKQIDYKNLKDGSKILVNHAVHDQNTALTRN